MAEKDKSLLAQRLEESKVITSKLNKNIEAKKEEKDDTAEEILQTLKSLVERKIVSLPEGTIDKKYIKTNKAKIKKIIEERMDELGSILEGQKTISDIIPFREKIYHNEADRLAIEKNVLTSIPAERAEAMLWLREYFAGKYDLDVEEKTSIEKAKGKEYGGYETSYREAIRMLHEGIAVFEGTTGVKFPGIDTILYKDPLYIDTNNIPVEYKRYIEENSPKKEFGGGKITHFDERIFAKKCLEKLGVPALLQKTGQYIATKTNTFDDIFSLMKYPTSKRELHLNNDHRRMKIVTLYFLWQSRFDLALVAHENRKTYYMGGPAREEDRFEIKQKIEGNDPLSMIIPLASKISAQQKKEA